MIARNCFRIRFMDDLDARELSHMKFAASDVIISGDDVVP